MTMNMHYTDISFHITMKFKIHVITINESCALRCLSLVGAIWLSAPPILFGAQEDLSFNPAMLALRVTPTQQCPHICPNRLRAHLARPGLKNTQEALCQSKGSGTRSELHVWEAGFHKMMCGYDCCECLPWGLLSWQRLKPVQNCSSG